MAIRNKKMDQLYSEALTLSLKERRELAQWLLQSQQPSEKEVFLQQLSEAGLLAEFPKGLEKYIPEEAKQQKPYLIEIDGSPLSQTIIEDRR